MVTLPSRGAFALWPTTFLVGNAILIVTYYCYSRRLAAWYLDPVWGAFLPVVLLVTAVCAGALVVYGIIIGVLSLDVGSVYIVCAVLLICAALAIPGYLESRARSLITSSSLNLRTLEMAIVEHLPGKDRMPLTDIEASEWWNKLPDPFGNAGESFRIGISGENLVLLGRGPDRVFEPHGDTMKEYNPSNGLFSSGDMIRQVDSLCLTDTFVHLCEPE